MLNSRMAVWLYGCRVSRLFTLQSSRQDSMSLSPRNQRERVNGRTTNIALER